MAFRVMVDIRCHICCLDDLPASVNEEWTKKNRSTRRKPSKGENKWISCDSCFEWCHPFCCGLQRDEYLKLDAGTRSNKKAGKSDIFFKCVLCNLKTFDLAESVEKYREKVINKIESASDFASDSDLSRKTLDKSSSLSTDKETSSEEGKSGNSKNIEFVVQNEEEIREKIIIVDELDKPEEYRNSSNILKEIKKVSNQRVELAYPLSKGGIAIHTESKASRDSLVELLSAGSFGGGKISTLNKFKKVSFFIKNVDTKVSIHEIRTKLQSHGLFNFECNRIINSYTQRPTKTIRVIVDSQEESRILNTKIKVSGQDCVIEKQSGTVIRCYGCQQFGHIAKNCQAAPKCVVCAGSHRSDFSCKNTVKCGNCEGGHLSSDKKCPIFVKQYESLTKQYPKY